jgi:uncharacterized repeat protein (TIGR03987 family)
VDPLRLSAVVTVTLALALYTVANLKERRSRRADAGVLGFFSVALFFDVTATILMILASRGQGISMHGVLGYSALAFMLVDVSLLWRHRRRQGDAPVPKGLHLYSLVSYLYWVVAYFAGAALVMAAKRAG